MERSVARMLSILWLGAVVAGCGVSAPARFYTLHPTASADGMPAATYAVAVGPVSIPATVDRPQFVVQVGPNQVLVDEFNRWASPLDDSIARAVAGDLTVLLGTPRVSMAPLANLAADYQVTIAVQRFDSIPGEAAVVEAVWAVRDMLDGATRSGRTVTREAAQGVGFDALTAAHSRAVAAMSRDIAAAIRAEAASRAAPGRRTGRGAPGR